MIYCPAQRGMSLLHITLQGYCCHNSQPTLTNCDYNMTKQICIKCIYDRISCNAVSHWLGANQESAMSWHGAWWHVMYFFFEKLKRKWTIIFSYFDDATNVIVSFRWEQLLGIKFLYQPGGKISIMDCKSQWILRCRADFRFAPSQWETVLPCNDISHWLCASL